jgi:DNA-binding MarR family transcriptional regulator
VGAAARDDRLDEEILDLLGGLIASLLGQAEQVARCFGVPTVFIKALHLLDGPMPMKELGRRMHCDPSFVTSVADMLESRGLVTREADPGDRRVKKLVLTPAGRALREQMAEEVRSRMPWHETLDRSERACLLELVRKMLQAGGQDTGRAAAAREAGTGEVSALLNPSPQRG